MSKGHVKKPAENYWRRKMLNKYFPTKNASRLKNMVNWKWNLEQYLTYQQTFILIKHSLDKSIRYSNRKCSINTIEWVIVEFYFLSYFDRMDLARSQSDLGGFIYKCIMKKISNHEIFTLLRRVILKTNVNVLTRDVIKSCLNFSLICR